MRRSRATGQSVCGAAAVAAALSSWSEVAHFIDKTLRTVSFILFIYLFFVFWVTLDFA